MPFINKEKLPKTAEQLMRSRFSAYVTGNGQYIFDTYAKSNQDCQSVTEINDWSETCKWIALQIHATNDSNNNGDIIKHSELVQIKRKALCPCNSFSTAWTIKKW